MKNLISYFVLVLLCCLGATVYANNTAVKFNKVIMQLDRAEIFAANCAMDSKADKKIHANCIQANIMLQQVKEKLDRIANQSTTDDIAENINRLKAKISKTNEHLTEAKVVTGDYEWTNSFIPSIKP